MSWNPKRVCRKCYYSQGLNSCAHVLPPEVPRQVTCPSCNERHFHYEECYCKRLSEKVSAEMKRRLFDPDASYDYQRTFGGTPREIARADRDMEDRWRRG